MNTLQKTIINQYQEAFPRDTLQEISRKTGIQITRVFRILNGSDMKVKEYEAFQNAIGSIFTYSDFVDLSKTYITNIDSKKVQFIINLMQSHLKIKSLQEDKKIELVSNQFA